MNSKITKTALRIGAVLVIGLVIGAIIHKLILCIIIGLIVGGLAIMASKINANSKKS